MARAANNHNYNKSWRMFESFVTYHYLFCRIFASCLLPASDTALISHRSDVPLKHHMQAEDHIDLSPLSSHSAPPHFLKYVPLSCSRDPPPSSPSLHPMPCNCDSCKLHGSLWAMYICTTYVLPSCAYSRNLFQNSLMYVAPPGGRLNLSPGGLLTATNGAWSVAIGA
jgi:hypothetical protein